MSTDTEALRAQFEKYVNPDGDVNLHWQEAGYYAGSGMQESWLDFQAGYQAGHAADTIDTLRTQLAEAQRDAERWNRAVQCARLDQFGGFVVTPDEPAFASDVSLAFIRAIDAAIGAAKGPT